MLDALPRSPDDTLLRRLFYWWVVVATSCVVAAIVLVWLGGAGGRGTAAALTLPLAPALIVIVVAGLFVRARGVRALAAAEARFAGERPASLAAAARALRLSATGDRWVRGWLIFATDAEERGAFETAEEALVRAANADDAGALYLEARLRLAFVRAVLGRVDEAEHILSAVAPDARASDALRAAHARAQALVSYRRARYREVVDLAASVTLPRERDRRLLEALARSSMLRLDTSASPMRTAAAEVEASEWLDELVPELRMRR